MVRASASDPQLLALLALHPRVEVIPSTSVEGLEFVVDQWRRRIAVGDATLPVAGLIELMDNNPLVCADAASVPGPVATLALVALGPLARAGLLQEPPVLIASEPFSQTDVEPWLEIAGWTGGVTSAQPETTSLAGTVAVTAMAVIATPKDLTDVDDLYDEAYGRSFLVRRDDESEWTPELVGGKPFALYRYRISGDDEQALLTIHAIAARNGKCGAAQVVHCMNVMCGFEETLGLTA